MDIQYGIQERQGDAIRWLGNARQCEAERRKMALRNEQNVWAVFCRIGERKPTSIAPGMLIAAAIAAKPS